MVEIARKVRLDNIDEIYRWNTKARVVASLQHENVLVPSAFGVTASNYPFLVWPVIETSDLWDQIYAGESKNVQHIARVFRPVCDALGIAYSAGVVLDVLYPGDLMFLKSSENKMVMGGFGRTLFVPLEDRNAVGWLNLVQHYKAPELCLGMSPSERSEIYAVGCLMYEAWTGKPYELPDWFTRSVKRDVIDDCSKWLYSRKEQTYVTRTTSTGSANERFEMIILKCLQTNPNKRYADLVEVKAELLRCLHC